MCESRRGASVLLPASIALLCGCEPMVVELGRGQIAPVSIERTVPTFVEPGEGCPGFRAPWVTPDARAGEITVAPLSRGCLLAMRQEGAILMSSEVISYWADQLQGQDLSALIGIDMVIDSLLVDGGPGFPIALEDVRTVSMHLDGRVLFDEVDMVALGAGSPEVRMPVPQELVDRIMEAIAGRKSLTAELEIRIVLHERAAVPTLMHVRAQLQPILYVDGWKAIF